MSEVDDTTQEAAETADAQEWDSALESYESEKGVKSEAPQKATEQETQPPAEEETQPPEEETQPPAEAPDEEAKAQREAAARAREVREANRDYVADVEAVREDIMAEMFKDRDGKLYDADGDEIKTIDDVMGLRNPNTGKNFTEDEAGAYFLKATQHAQREREEAIQQAERIADEMVSLKDQADTVKDKYGDFLNDPKNAQLKAEIWADYEATFVMDEATGIITKAPVSMTRFYDRALKPYMEAQTSISSAEQAKAEAEAAAAKAKAEADKARSRNDREDIFARGDSGRDTLSKEEAEWADAEKAYYGKK